MPFRPEVIIIIRLLILSDSHGTSENMPRLILSYRPNMVLHLGDGTEDISAISDLPPGTLIRTVRGNNDFASRAPEQAVFPLGSHKAFMTHGHFYNVRNTYSQLLQKAKNEGADIVLFGHTHKPANFMENGILLFNPGSFCSLSHNGGYYDIIEISDDGRITASIKNIRNEDT